MALSRCRGCRQEIDFDLVDRCWKCGYLPFRHDTGLLRPAAARRPRRRPRLIETLVALSILAFLLVQSTEVLQKLMTKAGEGMTRGNLGTLRSVIQLYFAANDGRYPEDLSQLTKDRAFLRSLPKALRYVRPHDSSGSNGVVRMTSAQYRAGKFTDDGGWAYVGSGPDKGVIVVNCTHTDSRGRRWFSY